jgi:glycosyltransferase involved in cell wall biosynthesis
MVLSAMATAPPPAISVLMAVRDGAPFLPDALASLANQDFQDFEIVLVDNGSRDQTPGIVAAWAEREPRLRPVRLERPGLARSLRLAASLARAPILARLDADDVAMPSRLRLQYAAMQRSPSLGLLGSSVEVINSVGQKIGERHLPARDRGLKEFLKSGNPFVHSSVMMRREAYEQAGGYREGLRVCEDFDLWCRMAEVTDVDGLDTLLVRYRLHREGMSYRQTTRVALTDVCIIAAQHARRAAKPEPFDRGMPKLRHALALLDIRREEFLYRALKAVTGAARLALEFGDRARANRIRRRAYRILAALPFGKAMLGGAGHILASYFRRYSRRRRHDLRAKLLGHGSSAGEQ